MNRARVEIHDPTEFGRVAVLFGGTSSEREVSLQSGTAVLEALRSRKVSATPWDTRDRSLAELKAAGFDRVWNALHGAGGEDGVLQGALSALDIPYTGSGVLASALAMDKTRSKQIFSAANIPTPEFATVTSVDDAVDVAKRFDFPLIVKPPRQGSSIGMSRVDHVGDLRAAVELALRYGSEALVERCVDGAEVTVSVLQGEALPSIRVETPHAFYDYRAKYEEESTRYICPATQDAETARLYATLALRAFSALACAGWGRVDLMHAEGEMPQVLEVNTVPGMTSHSLVPIAANAAGVSFEDLCWRVLETSFEALEHADFRATSMGEAAANDA